jgi:L-malate glycosyltransferase
MKHILFVLPYLELGGTEKHAFSLMNSLQQHYHVSLLAPAGRGAAPFWQAGFDHQEFPRLEENLWLGIRQFRHSLLAIHRQRSIDLVHVHAAHELTSLVKMFLPGVPVVLTVHGYHGSQSPLSYRLSAIFGNLFADRVIVVSRSELDLLAVNHLQAAKTTLIYNGVAEPQVDLAKVNQLAEQLALGLTDQILIGTVARLSEAKGLVYLLEAMAHLIDRHPYIKLVIAGDGELRDSLPQIADDLGIRKQVVFAGYLPDVQNLMYCFDIFVLPSLQEALPLASAEAMSMGKPIVATNVGGMPEQVTDGQTGFIVPPQDSWALAAGIDRLISDPVLLTDFGKRGYARYREKFALSGMLTNTVDVYEEALIS